MSNMKPFENENIDKSNHKLRDPCHYTFTFKHLGATLDACGLTY